MSFSVNSLVIENLTLTVTFTRFKILRVNKQFSIKNTLIL
jgi:hypothetical protein